MNMMTDKTLVISEIFPPTHGGSGRWFYELYSRLDPGQYLIAAGSTRHDEQFDSSHNIDVTRINLSSTSWGIRSITGLKFYLGTFFRLRKIIKSKQVRRIHCGRCLPEGVFGWLFNKLYGIPYICYVHGEDIETASSSRELSFIINHVLGHASTIIANSNNSKSILTEDWNIPTDKVAVLHPGMDASRFVPAEHDAQFRSSMGWGDKPVLLTVGRLQKRKGQDMLIRSLPAIKQHYPDVIYAIIGDGEERDHLNALVDELDLRQNVQFLTETSDEELIRCYQQCTLFILPNREVNGDIEGFGMVLAEAQACGKPVIAGDSGGTAETMIVGVTGKIVDCTDPSPLADSVINMLDEQDGFSEIGTKARTHVVTALDWPTHVDKAVKIFDQLAR